MQFGIGADRAGRIGDPVAGLEPRDAFADGLEPTVELRDATKRLRENGYITMDREGFITLTDSGMAIAASMLDRHHTLTRFLITLGVDPKVAEEDACKIEHDISDETFAAICAHAVRHGEKK